MNNNTKKKKILFLNEKYCDGSKAKGLSNSVHNLYGSFLRYDKVKNYDWSILHFDELLIEKQVHIDVLKKKIWEQIKPDIIICCLLGRSQMNPSKDFFWFFKEKNVHISLIWPDIGSGWGFKEIEDLNPVISSHISWAHERNILNNPKVHWLWTPEDPDLYNFDPERDFDKKNIDVGFLGTIHIQERYDFLEFLKIHLKDKNLYFGGGQRQEALIPKQYADLTKSSKIILNFPASPSGFSQVKGRIFEATACGCLLMEKDNLRTKDFYIPGVEYVSFWEKEDCLDRIKFLLDSDEGKTKRKEITLAGYKRFQNNWTNNYYWDRVFNIIIGFDK